MLNPSVRQEVGKGWFSVGFGFLVVLGEGKREKENKDPRDEMLAVLTHFGRKAQIQKGRK